MQIFIFTTFARQHTCHVIEPDHIYTDYVQAGSSVKPKIPSDANVHAVES